MLHEVPHQYSKSLVNITRGYYCHYSLGLASADFFPDEDMFPGNRFWLWLCISQRQTENVLKVLCKHPLTQRAPSVPLVAGDMWSALLSELVAYK